MLTNNGPVPKLYLSIIEDVIESMRELFLDEGLEDRVLDDLRQLWESKMMQSKAFEDFRRTTVNSSNFVLQLPANYIHNDKERPASIVIPASQNIQRFQATKNSTETIATFSLPAALSYPVQIPAGVTLQTASGQLYKVKVPVVVTQAPAGTHPFTQPAHKPPTWRDASVPQPALVPLMLNPAPAKVMKPCPPPPNPQPPEQSSLFPPPPPPNPQPPEQSSLFPASQPSAVFQQQHFPAAPIEARVYNGEPRLEAAQPGLEPVNPGVLSSTSPAHFNAAEPCNQTSELKDSDVEDILKEVLEEERKEALMARHLPPSNADKLPDTYDKPPFDGYSELLDIVQLDGAAGNSDIEDEDGVPFGEDEFLGMINAEAMKALHEADGSSDADSISSSDCDVVDELANIEEEDPLNSGDDVIEQDIPDLFDTDNVIVCQYDKIHRSKNRWKFHLKDGVMCYGGRDYVFSKAIGEAEW